VSHIEARFGKMKGFTARRLARAGTLVLSGSLVLASCGGSPTALKKTYRKHVTSSTMLHRAVSTSTPTSTTSTTAASRYVPATPRPQMALTQFMSDADFAPVQTSIQNMQSDLTNGGATLQQDFSTLDGGIQRLVDDASAVESA